MREADDKEYAKDLELLFTEVDEILANTEQNLLALEKSPSDPVLIQEVFRAMHTLKGGAATLGLHEAVEVTHAMEAMLDGVRSGDTDVTKAVIDALFLAMDWLRNWRAAVSSGTVIPDPNSLLAGLAASESPDDSGEEKSATSPKSASSDIDVLFAHLDQIASEGRAVHVLTVTFRTDAPLLSVRCFQALSLVGEVAEVAGSSPSMDDIENDLAAEVLRLYIVGDADANEAKKVAATVPDVSDVSMRPYTASSVQPKAAQDGSPIRVERTNLGKTVRVDVSLLDLMMNMVGELVIDRTRLSQIASQLSNSGDSAVVGNELTSLASRLQRTGSQLQEGLMRARLLPLKSIAGKFPRMIRDLSLGCGKEVAFTMSGEGTEMDRTVLEAIDDPLIHLLRNAVDHGIEPPEQRVKAGKPRCGTVACSAWHEDNQILIRISDDGGGINGEKVRLSAVKKGLIADDASQKLSMAELVDLIFLPGFSTATVTTEVSGRGVGMDVVRANLERVNGQIEVKSELGEGTQFTLRLPLTLSIMRALLIRCGQATYAVSTSSVDEVFSLKGLKVGTVHGKPAMNLRGRVVPVISLAGVLKGNSWERNGSGYILLTRTHDRPLALAVDDLLGEEEIVVKELKAPLSRIRGIAGATILAEGEPAVILDVNRIT